MKFYSILVFLFFTVFSAYASERADAFIVRAYSDHYKVVAPAVKNKNMSVIIENKTLVNLVGRLETDKGRVITFVRIDSDSFKSIEVSDLGIKDKLYFVPLSPAFQKIILNLGEKSYEIPPKR